MKNHGVQKQHPIQAYVNVTTACLCFYMAWKGFNREDFYGPIPSRMKQCKNYHLISPGFQLKCLTTILYVLKILRLSKTYEKERDDSQKEGFK